MTLAEIISWQQTAIVALLITNGLTLAVALVAVSIIRLGLSELPAWAQRILDRMGGWT